MDENVNKVFNKTRLLVFIFFLSLLVMGFFFLHSRRIYHTILPIKFETGNLPYVDMMIEGKNYPLVLDLGSRLELDLHDDVLETLHKSPYGTEKWRNLKGIEFQYPAYLLPKVEIGSLTFRKVIVAEFPKEREKEYLITKDLSHKKRPSPTVGYLGRGLLKNVNLLMDMECSKVILTNSLKKLKKSGYDLTHFEQIPFELIPKGILVLVDTDLGRMKLLLDTGCTFSILHGFLSPQNIEEDADSYGFPTFESTYFTMNGIDFGRQAFYFIDITEALSDIDGFLGMDFIKKHVIYIDFSRKVLYIQK